MNLRRYRRFPDIAALPRPRADLDRRTPATDIGSGKIVFIIKVASLPSPLPPDTTWAITFATPSGGNRFVRMTTYPAGSPTFSSGLGSDPSPLLNGVPADAASSYSADGTIRIVLNRSGLGNLQPGQSLSSFLGTIRIAGGTIPVHADDAPNSQIPAGTYEVIGNDNCVGNVTPFAVDDTATVNTGFPTRLSLAANDADADDPLTIVSASDPPNGTTAVNADNTGYLPVNMRVQRRRLVYLHHQRWTGRNGLSPGNGTRAEDFEARLDLLARPPTHGAA